METSQKGISIKKEQTIISMQQKQKQSDDDDVFLKERLQRGFHKI
jgi:hypothetical protein